MKSLIRHALVATFVIASIVVALVSLNVAMEANARALQAQGRLTRHEQWSGEFRQKHSKDLTHLKLLKLAAIIRNSVDLSGKDNFEKAVSVRNHIHHNVPTNLSTEWFDTMDFDYMYVKSMRNEDSGHMCGGLALLYVAALESQGIPARYVGIFSDDKSPYRSHATVEFWHDGRWYASDPSTNMMFIHHGAYLSYAEIYGLVQEKEPFDTTTNRCSIMPERKCDNYAAMLSSITNYMVIHPSEVWRGNTSLPVKNDVHVAFYTGTSLRESKYSFGQPTARTREHVLRYPMQSFPATWDGAITFQDGQREDVRSFGGVYEYLHQGPLR